MLNRPFDFFKQSRLTKRVAIWILSTLLLFLGFYTNFWRVAEQNWFKNHQLGTESLIIGRMVKSRQDSIFSAGGLTGSGTKENVQSDWINSDWIVDQYSAFQNEGSFDNYWTYYSQPGGQGMVFSLLDRLIPISPKIKLEFFYILTSLLSAIALTFIVGWFYEEFGGLVAIFVISSAVLSIWLTGFGRNLWWCLWAFYLPMIAVLYYLKRHRNPDNKLIVGFGILVFIAVSIKCFINGYEYITTTLIMMVTPCIFYASLDQWSWQQRLKLFLAATFASGTAVILSLVMLCFQIAAVKDGFVDGIEHLVYSLGRRTYGNAEDFPGKYAASLKADTFEVAITYLYGVFFDFNNYITQANTFLANHVFKIRYYYLMIIFSIMSIILFIQS